jgi:voltage-gated potassium channel
MSEQAVQRADARVARWEQVSELPLLIASLLFDAAFAAPIVAPAMPGGWQLACHVLLGVLWLTFAADFAGRWLIADSRRDFLASNVLDLIVVLCPILRPLRSLAVYTAVGSLRRRRHGREFQIAIYLVLTTVLLGCGLALIELAAERGAHGATITTPADAFWWSATTITGDFYGDMFPVTGAGRIISLGASLVGLGVFGVVAGSFASWLTRWYAGLARREDKIAETHHLLQETLRELRSAQHANPGQHNQTGQLRSQPGRAAEQERGVANRVKPEQVHEHPA